MVNDVFVNVALGSSLSLRQAFLGQAFRDQVREVVVVNFVRINDFMGVESDIVVVVTSTPLPNAVQIVGSRSEINCQVQVAGLMRETSRDVGRVPFIHILLLQDYSERHVVVLLVW